MSAPAAACEPQAPKGTEGLSFRSESYFEAADDFVCPTDGPIAAVRWWGSFADEAVPDDHTKGQFRIRIYNSSGSLPVGSSIAEYTVEAAETWTEGFCRGIEGLGGGDVCVGPEPLYVYEACIDPPFVPQAGTEYWIGILHLLNDESRFWAWHEADLSHPTGNEAATWSSFFGWEAGLINACPGDFSFTVGPYDLAFELLGDCPGAGGCPTTVGDLTGDGLVRGDDIGCFVECLVTGSTTICESCACADMDDDGELGSVDVSQFVSTLLGL